MDKTTFAVMTANQPGAVGLIQLHGRDVTESLQRLTGRGDWPVGRLRLCRFADIDEGLAVLLQDGVAQLMPHGGPRVMQKLVAWLVENGVEAQATPDPVAMYREANSPIEADVLHAIATAASPAAIDLLAAQPALWKAWFENSPQSEIPNPKPQLAHLLTPPTVVVVGPPNVGKSTLLNRLLGRSASVVADLPGTTRDWVGGLVELTPPAGDPRRDAVAVRWLDTPGLRTSDDTVEQSAIGLARSVIASADVLIAMRDPQQAWPPLPDMTRPPDLWVVNKVAEADHASPPGDALSQDHPLMIEALTGRGVAELTAAVFDRLGLGSIQSNQVWAFSPTLRRAAEGHLTDWPGYLFAQPMSHQATGGST